MTNNTRRAAHARRMKYGTIIWKRVYVPKLKQSEIRREQFDEIEKAYRKAIMKLNGRVDNFLDPK